MIAMKSTLEFDIGRSFLLQAALAQPVTDRETKDSGDGGADRVAEAVLAAGFDITADTAR